jgi:hypothetical protein
MKLTRKRAIEKIIEEYENTPNGFSDFEWAKNGVDYGIVLGLQMAARMMKNHWSAFVSPALFEQEAARRLKKLEKAK